jgi:hypothetical protein
LLYKFIARTTRYAFHKNRKATFKVEVKLSGGKINVLMNGSLSYIQRFEVLQPSILASKRRFRWLKSKPTTPLQALPISLICHTLKTPQATKLCFEMGKTIASRLSSTIHVSHIPGDSIMKGPAFEFLRDWEGKCENAHCL